MEQELRAKLFYKPRDIETNLTLALLFYTENRLQEACEIYAFLLSFVKDKYARNICYRNMLQLNGQCPQVPILSKLYKPYVKFPLTMTTCKRFDLFQRTIQSFFKNVDSQCIERVLIIDDNSSDEDVDKMFQILTDLEVPFKIISKDPEQKGHARSLNILLKQISSFKAPFFIHLEDDFDFFIEAPLVRMCAEVLACNPRYGQCLFNNSYREGKNETALPWGIDHETPSGIPFYEHLWKDPSSPHGYWPGFSLRPGLNRVEMFQEIGEFIEAGCSEHDYALRAVEANWKTTYLEAVYCEHIGRKTSERTDSSKSNAYVLNDCPQFANFSYKSIFIQDYAKNVDTNKEIWNGLFLADVKTLGVENIAEKIAHVKLWQELVDNFKNTQAFLVHNCATPILHSDWEKIYYKLNQNHNWDILYIEQGDGNNELRETQEHLIETSPAYVIHHRSAKKLLSIVKESGALRAFDYRLRAYMTSIVRRDSPSVNLLDD